MKLLAIVAVGGAVGLSVSLNAQSPNPETVYYADAYADHYQVPRALVHAIIAQESDWNPLALSDKGAAGLMQLMPETARAYGVKDRYRATDMVLSEKDLAPGTTAEGVLTLQPADIEKPEMYEFVFGNDGKHTIQATAVL